MKFQQDIHPSKLKYELGNQLYISKENEKKYLPKNTYTIYSSEDMGIKLFCNNDFFLIEEWDENTVYKVMRLDEEERIENLIASTFQEILILTAEGWTEKDNSQTYFNLSPLIEKLETYKKIKNVLTNKDDNTI